MWVRTVAWEVLTHVFYISMLLMGPENGILRQVLTGRNWTPTAVFCLGKRKTLDSSNPELSSVSEDGAGGGTRTHLKTHITIEAQWI